MFHSGKFYAGLAIKARLALSRGAAPRPAALVLRFTGAPGATGAGEPVEFALAAGSEADVSVFKDLELDLPEGSNIFADKAYTDSF